MKAIIVLCALLAVATAVPAGLRKPASKPEDSFETFFSSFFGGDSSSAEDSSAPDDDYYSPSFFNIGFPAMPDFSSMFPGFPPLPDLFGLLSFIADPLSDPNTKVINSTSHTEVINGHNVVINTTVYENKNTGMKSTVVEMVADFGDEKDTPVIDGTDSPATGDSKSTTAANPSGHNSEENEVIEPNHLDQTEWRKLKAIRQKRSPQFSYYDTGISHAPFKSLSPIESHHTHSSRFDTRSDSAAGIQPATPPNVATYHIRHTNSNPTIYQQNNGQSYGSGMPYQHQWRNRNSFVPIMHNFAFPSEYSSQINGNTYAPYYQTASQQRYEQFSNTFPHSLSPGAIYRYGMPWQNVALNYESNWPKIARPIMHNHQQTPHNPYPSTGPHQGYNPPVYQGMSNHPTVTVLPIQVEMDSVTISDRRGLVSKENSKGKENLQGSTLAQENDEEEFSGEASDLNRTKVSLKTPFVKVPQIPPIEPVGEAVKRERSHLLEQMREELYDNGPQRVIMASPEKELDVTEDDHIDYVRDEAEDEDGQIFLNDLGQNDFVITDLSSRENQNRQIDENGWKTNDERFNEEGTIVQKLNTQVESKLHRNVNNGEIMASYTFDGIPSGVRATEEEPRITEKESLEENQQQALLEVNDQAVMGIGISSGDEEGNQNAEGGIFNEDSEKRSINNTTCTTRGAQGCGEPIDLSNDINVNNLLMQ